MEHETSSPRDWNRGRLLGSGSFGRVHLAVDSASGDFFAVKSAMSPSSQLPDRTPMPSQASPASPAQPDRLNNNNGAVDALENEISILSALDCPQIVGFRGAEWSQEGDRKVRNLFLEYAAGGSVTGLLRSSSGRCCGLDALTLRKFTKDVVSGLCYLHERNIVHGDIKSLNLLLTSDGHVKLADFGAAFCVSSKTAAIGGASNGGLRGTVNWMAPEVGRREQQSCAVDIWSLGCTVLEMATGRPAWSDVTGGTFSVLYAVSCTEDLPQIPAEVPAAVRDFIACCLRRDPAKRWTAAQLLAHPFLAEAEAAAEEAVCARKAALVCATPRSPTCPFEFGASSDSECDSVAPAAAERSATLKRKRSCSGDDASEAADVAESKRQRDSAASELGLSFVWPKPVLCPAAADWIVVVALRPVVQA